VLAAERGQRLVGRALSRKSVPEVSDQAEAGRVEGDAGDVQRRLAGFVEGQLERVAVQQVDAVERRVLRRGGDLRMMLLYWLTRWWGCRAPS
jgi:hypothetical protein